jgi:parvulin-like peptidyl-prolyl isomerase
MRFGLVNSLRLACVSFLFCSLFAQFGIQEQNKVESVDGVAAIVENDVILKSDVMQQSYLLAQQRGVDPFKSPQTFEALYLSVLDQMVDNLVLYQISLRDTNIVVDPLVVEESVKSELNKRIEYAGSASKLEEMFGEPLSMIRAKLRLEIKKALRIERFTGTLYQSTTPSLLDVKNFYNTFKDSLPRIGSRVSFSVFEWPIKLDNNKELGVVSFLNQLKDSVAMGVSFYDLAIKHSDDKGSSSSGGRLGFFVRGSLFPEYEAAAFGLDVGQVSEPFKTDLGYHIVLLEDRVGEKIQTAHILKRVESGVYDVEKNKDDLFLFLREKDVYNSVEKFDSLCAHFSVDKPSAHGVFRGVPVSSVPDFLGLTSLDSVGFRAPVFNKNSLFVVRVFDYFPEQAPTLNNYYLELFNLTQNQLMSDKISNLINKTSKTLYIKKFY